jgi:hypothetical protein
MTELATYYESAAERDDPVAKKISELINAEFAREDEETQSMILISFIDNITTEKAMVLLSPRLQEHIAIDDWTDDEDDLPAED